MNGAGGYNSSSVYIRKLVRQQPHLARVEKGPTPACTSPATGLGCGGSDAVNKSEARLMNKLPRFPRGGVRWEHDVSMGVYPSEDRLQPLPRTRGGVMTTSGCMICLSTFWINRLHVQLSSVLYFFFGAWRLTRRLGCLDMPRLTLLRGFIDHCSFTKPPTLNCINSSPLGTRFPRRRFPSRYLGAIQLVDLL
jgi:hypothetical protein